MTVPFVAALDDAVIAARLKALSHPARIAIIRSLAVRDCCCCGEFVRPLSLAQSTVSQHLKILREAGLVSGEAEGVRSSYRLERGAFADLAGVFAGLVAEIGTGAPDGCCPGSEALGSVMAASVTDNDKKDMPHEF